MFSRLLIIISALFFTLVTGQRYPSQIPNPVTNPKECGCETSSWICDPDNILSPEAKTWFNGYALDLEGKTKNSTCSSGDQIASAWIKNMHVNWYESPAEVAKKYAQYLHDSWKVGDDKCNNGLVLFVSLEDRQIYISIGAGLLDRLSEDDAHKIIEIMAPQMREQDYNLALEKGVNKIGSYLNPNPWILVGIIIGSLLGGICVCSLSICCCMKCYQYDKRSSELKEMFKQAKLKGKFDQDDCPICLENFKEIGSNVVDLDCGHRFCQKCLEGWTSSKHAKKMGYESIGKPDDANNLEAQLPTCPICRRAISPSSTSIGQNYDTNITSGPSSSNINNEMRFRMTSLHYMYPLFISYNYANNWTEPVYQPSYSYNSHHTSSGHHNDSSSTWNWGSSYSTIGGSSWNTTTTHNFGGGSSFGGGGAGGSW